MANDLIVAPGSYVPQAIVAPTIDIKQREVTHVGSRYEGSVSIATGRREGKGTYVYPNSFFKYEGEWLDGKKHGRGRLFLGEDYGFYEGEFNQGEIFGQGAQTWKDGTVYTGQFVSGEKHGNGAIDRSDGSSYNGSWECNKYSGQGELTLPNGDCYIGAFKGHKYHGKGVLTQPAADRRYEGLFEAGLFQGEGELKERGGAFVYNGQFNAGSMSGTGKGADTASGIAYEGAWEANAPAGRSAAWDLAPTADAERAGESFIPMSEILREEAAEQLTGPSDPKAKAKAKAGGKSASPEPTPDLGPELELFVGRTFPEVVLRLVDSESKPLSGESGRRWKVTMFRERQRPKEDEPSEMETLRREVRFGDKRPAYEDPLFPEPVDPKAAAKKAPSPPPKPAAGEEEEEEVEIPSGEASMDGAVGGQGEVKIGNGDAWLLPVHLQPAIYWLRVEDTTEGLSSGGPYQQLPPLEFPVKVKAPE